LRDILVPCFILTKEATGKSPEPRNAGLESLRYVITGNALTCVFEIPDGIFLNHAGEKAAPVSQGGFVVASSLRLDEFVVGTPRCGVRSAQRADPTYFFFAGLAASSSKVGRRCCAAPIFRIGNIILI
jgi:hypothetical protein